MVILILFLMLIFSVVPNVSVQVRDGGAAPTAGVDYRLTCSISGVGNLNPTTTYRWTKNSGSGRIQVETDSNTLSFTPLRLSDAASYVCDIAISSSYLSADIIAVSVNSQDIIIQSEHLNQCITPDWCIHVMCAYIIYIYI